jgi:hypothetical protein
MKTNKLLIALMGSVVMATAACDKTDRSFSLLDAGSTFHQAGTFVPKKMDILWVIDNSGSMASSQTNLTNNFQSFIDKFQKNGYDYHMAVTGTDAWRAFYQSNTTNKDMLRRARPGEINFGTNPLTYKTNSGVFVMDQLTPNLSQVFLTNAMQNTTGTGDERAFASFKEFLNFTGNADFHRPDATLAIIIISDEDDFSSNTSGDIPDNNYNGEVNADPLVLPASTDPANLYNLYRDPNLDTVQSYKDYLDAYAGAGNYKVHAISVLDNTCKANLNSQTQGRRLGRRYMQLVDLTGGEKTSLCDNFADSLQKIQTSIIQLSSTFKLDREPVVDSIKPIVDGVSIPNDAQNGWTYNAADWSVTFHGSSVPAQGSNIQILFTPVRAAN